MKKIYTIIQRLHVNASTIEAEIDFQFIKDLDIPRYSNKIINLIPTRNYCLSTSFKVCGIGSRFFFCY